MSGSSQVEIVLHINEALNAEQEKTLVEDLKTLDGVSDAHFAPRGRDHLVVVDYDPDRANSQQILAKVQEHHVHAALVGPA
ncbi:MAG TPA: heavy-metal-associated domain-containing protein [Gammaproteobacteria bacterium]|nr:heavy-metal-associated domain-containing protein [Gammaproteobacteria bacterium]